MWQSQNKVESIQAGTKNIPDITYSDHIEPWCVLSSAWWWQNTHEACKSFSLWCNTLMAGIDGGTWERIGYRIPLGHHINQQCAADTLFIGQNVTQPFYRTPPPPKAYWGSKLVRLFYCVHRISVLYWCFCGTCWWWDSILLFGIFWDFALATMQNYVTASRSQFNVDKNQQWMLQA